MSSSGIILGSHVGDHPLNRDTRPPDRVTFRVSISTVELGIAQGALDAFAYAKRAGCYRRKPPALRMFAMKGLIGAVMKLTFADIKVGDTASFSKTVTETSIRFTSTPSTPEARLTGALGERACVTSSFRAAKRDRRSLRQQTGTYAPFN